MHYRYLTIEQRESLERLIQNYGVCASCGADIPYVRLAEFPAAEHCAACQPKG